MLLNKTGARVSFGPPVGATILAHLGKVLIISKSTGITMANFFKSLGFLMILPINKVINLYHPINEVPKKGIFLSIKLCVK